MHPIGTLATATVRGVPGVRVLATTDGAATGWTSAVPVLSFTFHGEDVVTDVEAGAVVTTTDDEIALLRGVAEYGLDLEGEEAEQLAALADRLEAGRALLKPLEPTHRGAIVLDQDHRQWVRAGDLTAPDSWVQHETEQTASYAQIDAVAVLP